MQPCSSALRPRRLLSENLITYKMTLIQKLARLQHMIINCDSFLDLLGHYGGFPGRVGGHCDNESVIRRRHDQMSWTLETHISNPRCPEFSVCYQDKESASTTSQAATASI